MSSAAQQFRTHFAAGEGEGSKHCLFHCSMKAKSVSCQCGLRFCCTLGVSLGQRMKQVPNRKQREAKDGTPEIEVMTNAMLQPPIHPRKQVKCFGDMSKNDYHQTSCAE